MGRYHYRAKSGIETVDGFIEAETREEAVIKIEALGYLPIEIEMTRFAPAPKKERLSRAAVSKREVLAFTRQLHTLLRSKVGLVNALDIMRRQARTETMQGILSQAVAEIKQGRQLSETLASYPQIFDRVYLSMVMAGEQGGILESILANLVELGEREDEMRSKVSSALTYPALMAVVGGGTIIFMLAFVMPKMVKIFGEMRQDLPIPTTILIAVSNFLSAYWVAIVAVLAAVFFLCRRLLTIKTYRLIFDGFLLTLPAIGETIVLLEASRFCRTLGTLLKSGIHVREAIVYTTPIVGNEAIAAEMEGMDADLSAGKTFHDSLGRAAHLPGALIDVVKVGEEAGMLNESLLEAGAEYDRQLDRRLKTVNALLEPVFVLVIGGIVGFIVSAMLLPIFQLNVQ